jgi:hypothetical protein
MKKKHGVFFGFAVLLVAVIFTLTGCDNGTTSTTNSEDDSPKKLTITGITGVNDPITVALFNESNKIVAGYWGNISGDSVTISLHSGNDAGTGFGDSAWTGSGTYAVALWHSSNWNSRNPDKILSNQITFSQETTTVEWDKFQ